MQEVWRNSSRSQCFVFSKSLWRSWWLLVAFMSLLCFSAVFQNYADTAFTSGRMHLRGRIASRVVPPCNTVLRLYALPFPAAMASGGAFVLGRAFRSISIRYCRAPDGVIDRFSLYSNHRRLNLRVYAALGSDRGYFARWRCECVLIKIGRELYVRSTRRDSSRMIRDGRWRDRQFSNYAYDGTGKIASGILIIRFYLRRESAMKTGCVCN